MDLEKQTSFGMLVVRRLQALLIPIVLTFSFLTIPVVAQSPNRKPELIRDTDAAEGKENSEVDKPKEYSPLAAAQNIKIGNFYLKQKNYVAAIQRYLEAIGYQPNSIEAYEALARAYEKNGEKAKAADTYKSFILKYPDLPISSEFRARLAKLEKKP
jgi:tetratricopeptide (TPR) repeat protein